MPRPERSATLGLNLDLTGVEGGMQGLAKAVAQGAVVGVEGVIDRLLAAQKQAEEAAQRAEAAQKALRSAENRSNAAQRGAATRAGAERVDQVRVEALERQRSAMDAAKALDAERQRIRTTAQERADASGTALKYTKAERSALDQLRSARQQVAREAEEAFAEQERLARAAAERQVSLTKDVKGAAAAYAASTQAIRDQATALRGLGVRTSLPGLSGAGQRTIQRELGKEDYAVAARERIVQVRTEAREGKRASDEAVRMIRAERDAILSVADARAKATNETLRYTEAERKALDAASAADKALSGSTKGQGGGRVLAGRARTADPQIGQARAQALTSRGDLDVLRQQAEALHALEEQIKRNGELRGHYTEQEQKDLIAIKTARASVATEVRREFSEQEKAAQRAGAAEMRSGQGVKGAADAYARLTQVLQQYEEAFRALNLHLGTMPGLIGKSSEELEDYLKKFGTLDAGAQISGRGRGSSAAQGFALNTSRMMNDLLVIGNAKDGDIFSMQTLNMVAMATANNIDMVVSDLREMMRVARESGQSLWQAFKAGAAGGAGFSIALNGVILAMQMLPVLWRALESEQSKALRTARAYAVELREVGLKARSDVISSSDLSKPGALASAERSLARMKQEAADIQRQMGEASVEMLQRYIGSDSAERILEMRTEEIRMMSEAEAQSLEGTERRYYDHYQQLIKLQGGFYTDAEGEQKEHTSAIANEEERLAAHRAQIYADAETIIEGILTESQQEREERLADHALELARINADANENNIGAQADVIRLEAEQEARKYREQIARLDEQIAIVEAKMKEHLAQVNAVVLQANADFLSAAPNLVALNGSAMPDFFNLGRLGGTDYQAALDILGRDRSDYQELLDAIYARMRRRDANMRASIAKRNKPKEDKPGGRSDADWLQEAQNIESENAQVVAATDGDQLAVQRAEMIQRAEQEVARLLNLRTEIQQAEKATAETKRRVLSAISARLGNIATPEDVRNPAFQSSVAGLLGEQMRDQYDQMQREAEMRRREMQRAAEDLDAEGYAERLSMLSGYHADEARLRHDHLGRVQELERRVADELLKKETDQNKALIDALRNRIEQEDELFEVRRARLRSDHEMERARVALELQTGDAELNILRRLYDANIRLYEARAAQRRLLSTPSQARAVEDAERGLRAAEAEAETERELLRFKQERAALEDRRKTEAPTMERDLAAGQMVLALGGEMNEEVRAAYENALQVKGVYDRQIEQAEQAHQLRLKKIKDDAAEAERERQRKEAEERVRAAVESTMSAWQAALSYAQAGSDLQDAQRRQSLLRQGYTEEEATQIVEREGRRRFKSQQQWAIAEATVSAIYSAQKAFQLGMEAGNPILAYAGAAAALLAGMARVRQIRQVSVERDTQAMQNDGAMGASWTGYGVTYDPEGTGAQATNAPRSSAQRAATNMAVAAGGIVAEEMRGLRADLNRLGAEIARRPAVVTQQTSADIARTASNWDASYVTAPRP